MEKRNNLLELTGREQFTDALTELLKSGAQNLIQEAVEAEFNEFMQQFSGKTLENGRAAIECTR